MPATPRRRPLLGRQTNPPQGNVPHPRRPPPPVRFPPCRLGGPDRIRLRRQRPAHRDNWREFPAMVSTGISPLRALRAATSEAAALLATPDRGIIRPGALADLIAMPGNPFDDIDCTGNVDFVVQSGRVKRHTNP
ncbi:amidohydrolase family protein [Amycolatopsis sp. NPDC051716]|uniref:amidohydrolase family protein n=1 Tax=Amycolatopsis sp. NPDC051716 TaxID=3155804 RepID=UPI00341FF202